MDLLVSIGVGFLQFCTSLSGVALGTVVLAAVAVLLLYQPHQNLLPYGKDPGLNTDGSKVNAE